MAELPKKKICLRSGGGRRGTRSSSDYYLIGPSSPTIGLAKLPTLRDVLQYLLYEREVMPSSARKSEVVKRAVKQVDSIWLMEGIKTITTTNMERKLLLQYEKWLDLKKHLDRPSDNARDAFEAGLDKLWDVGARDAINTIQKNRLLTDAKKQEDIEFYKDQQGARIYSMSGKDKVFSQKSKERLDRLMKEIQVASSSSTDEELSSSLSATESAASACSSQFDIPSTSSSIRKEYITLEVPRNILESVEVSQTVDRLKLSDNAVTMLLSSFIKASRGDINNFSLSRTTIRRTRSATRLRISQSVYQSVQDEMPEHIALHWDGKLMTDRLGNKFESLAIIISAQPNFIEGKLLGIQKLESASGSEQAKATYDMLKNWNMVDRVKALVFDTTASNSGWKKGAAMLLEQFIGRKLFYHACRHHIYELIIRDVWKCLFGNVTTGPENPDFNKFKQSWQRIDLKKPYQTLQLDVHLQEKANAAVDFLSEAVETRQFLRDDYKQCALNALALLGATDPINFTHHKPGATHSARWMGTVLYAQKMFMFAEQMNYTEDYIKLLNRINVFLCLFYVPAWLDCGKATNAAINDLQFIKDMYNFLPTDTTVAETAIHKLKKHRWYLLEETAVYALFSDHAEVTSAVKEAIARNLMHTPKPTTYRTGVPTDTKDINRNTGLQDLIGPNSWFIFNSLNIEAEWLLLPSNQWEVCDGYSKMKIFINTLKVVNDASERGIKLSTDYATILTDDESQRASILQCVEEHRKKFPDFNKATLQ